MAINERKPYWSNTIGFLGFCTLLIFMNMSCTQVVIEEEKTKQLEMQHKFKITKK